MAKKMIKYDLPLQIGFFVYKYAKLPMLQFYYDFMMKYIDPRDFEYVEMDTDSAYIALASDSIEKVIKPSLRQEYYTNWGKWLPAEACSEHQKNFIQTKLAGLQWLPEPCCIAQQKYEHRTPGLFKVEWEGKGMVGLCSKTYFGWGNKPKSSAKGISRTHNELNKQKYLDVLLHQQSGSGVNTGFVVKDNQVFTYRQVRDGFNYFYPKRKVLGDGVSTVPLNLSFVEGNKKIKK